MPPFHRHPGRFPSLSWGVVAVLSTLTLWAEPLWKPLPPIPDPVGVAAPFAGVSGGALIVAGGANFPDRPPWQGGTKVWHDAVWVLDKPEGVWRRAGTLPAPRAYGISISVKDRVLCLGGSDASGPTAEVGGFRWRRDRLETLAPRDLPPQLPLPLANAAGVLDDRGVAYVACGSPEPGERVASGRVFTLTPGKRGAVWRELPLLPAEPRILPVIAGLADGFCLVGGAALESRGGRTVRRYLRDAWRYSAARGWERLPDLPHPCVAGASPAPVDRTAVYLLGGDDGSRAGRPASADHPGFSGDILRLDLKHPSWTTVGTLPAPRVTLPCVAWRGGWVLPSGEVRPGVRSPEVWWMRLR
ncbi:MAG: galactose oxidase [Verrucomicrobia bacterium]|nr:galactose oxidase [Verrucomicrobiota bacterium]